MHKCAPISGESLPNAEDNPSVAPRQLPLHKGASDAVLILTFLFPIGNYQRVETRAECKRKSRVKTNLSLPLKGLGGKSMNRGMPPSRGAQRRGNPFLLCIMPILSASPHACHSHLFHCPYHTPARNFCQYIYIIKCTIYINNV